MAVTEGLKQDAIIELLGDNEISAEIDLLQAKGNPFTRKEIATTSVTDVANDNPSLDDLSELVRLSRNTIRFGLSIPEIPAP